jgi:hypothetical protein
VAIGLPDAVNAARLNPNYLANENVDPCLTSVGRRLASEKLMGLEEIHREQDSGHQEDQRADDPHDDCAKSLIGHGRYVEWVWLPEVVTVDGAVAEGEKCGEGSVDDIG